MQRVPTIVTGVLPVVLSAVSSAVSSAGLCGQIPNNPPLFKKHKLDELVWYSGRTDKKLYVRFVW
jgi:hypothetical protein